MRVMKSHGSYLTDQMNHEKRCAIYNKIFYIILLIGSSALLLKFLHDLVFQGDQNRLLLVISLGLFAASFVVSRRGKRHDIQGLKYQKGMMGEASVADELKKLDDSYFVINDLLLKDRSGNIDHIILGPSGIFAVETKSLRGDIGCKGDEWTRRAQGSSSVMNLESPSLQVKRNAAAIGQLLHSASAGYIGKGKTLIVDGIVVFTDPKAHLELERPTVTVLKLEDLCDYVKHFRSDDRYSSKELEAITKFLLDNSK
jgi:hypothetical protein